MSEYNCTLVNGIHVKGKNVRISLSVYEFEDGTHVFILRSRRLHDKVMRKITEIEGIYGAETLFCIGDMIGSMRNDSEFMKKIRMELPKQKLIAHTTFNKF